MAGHKNHPLLIRRRGSIFLKRPVGRAVKEDVVEALHQQGGASVFSATERGVSLTPTSHLMFERPTVRTVPLSDCSDSSGAASSAVQRLGFALTVFERSPVPPVPYALAKPAHFSPKKK